MVVEIYLSLPPALWTTPYLRRMGQVNRRGAMSERGRRWNDIENFSIGNAIIWIGVPLLILGLLARIF